MTVCPHCDRPVIEGLMRGSGRLVRLDLETGARGNLELIEPGSVVRFIPAEYRDPKSAYFVPPEARYRAHQVSCPQNERTTSDATRAFIADCDARLYEASAPHIEGGTAVPECAPHMVGKRSGSADPVHLLSSR